VINLRVFGLVCVQLVATLLLSGCITINASEHSASETAAASNTEITSPQDSGDASAGDASSEDASATQTQSIDYTIAGGCQDSYEDVGYYGMLQSLNDDCTLVVEVFPPTPQRSVELQFFDDGWVMESSAITDSEGLAYLDVDPYCDDGLWCEGIWEYRVLVAEKNSLPQDTSITFEIEFFPN
jgi:uncharacterized protein YceK